MTTYHARSTWLKRLRRKACRDCSSALDRSMLPVDRRFDKTLCDKLRLPPHNVFRHLDDLKIPSIAYVAGAGPLLLEELKRLPPGAFVIACNRAIQAPYPFKIWMVFDLNCKRFDWYKKAPPGDYTKVFGYKLGREVPGALIFSSRHVEKPHLIAPAGLQGGGTIVSCAVQLLFWAGCEVVIMLGAPMKGDRHFDGTNAYSRNCIWKQAARMSYHAYQMQLLGMSIFALNSNAMGIPIWEGDLYAEKTPPGLTGQPA